MAEYTPAYHKTAPLTIEHFQARMEELDVIHAYATSHDDVLALDELFCTIVTLEHRIMRWERDHEERPRVATSLKELDRALKWAWLAREEEDHAGGMYAGKLKEAIAVLRDLYVFLDALRKPQGMTKEQAETLATTIKRRLPLAEVETKAETGGAVWVVEARNPGRGTKQVFHQPAEFEHLMAQAARPPTIVPAEGG